MLYLLLTLITMCCVCESIKPTRADYKKMELILAECSIITKYIPKARFSFGYSVSCSKFEGELSNPHNNVLIVRNTKRSVGIDDRTDIFLVKPESKNIAEQYFDRLEKDLMDGYHNHIIYNTLEQSDFRDLINCIQYEFAEQNCIQKNKLNKVNL